MFEGNMGTHNSRPPVFVGHILKHVFTAHFLCRIPGEPKPEHLAYGLGVRFCPITEAVAGFIFFLYLAVSIGQRDFFLLD